MYITFHELLQLKEMAMSNIIAGNEGVYRLITWYTISEIVDYKTQDYKNKLVFIAGIGMTEQDYEENLQKIIQYISSNGASGAIIEIGPYIPKVPAQITVFADSIKFPLLTLPFDIKISTLNYAMSQLLFSRTNYVQGMQNLVTQLLSLDNKIDTELMNRASFYGYRPENAYCVVQVEPDKKVNQKEFALFVISIIEGLVKNGVSNFLWKQSFEYLCVILPVDINAKISHRQEILSIFPDTKKYNYSAGVGSVFFSLSEVLQSSSEANEALYMIHQCGKKQEIRFFEDTGIYRLLFHFNNADELYDIYEHTLGALLQYDLENGTELNLTLENYLDCDCNVTATSEIMRIHRNTIKYRIQKIQDLLQVDFSDYDQCFQLRLAYKIKKYSHIS